MSIRHWPASERPRERLLAHGAGTLSDAELLAIFLRTGVAGRSAVDLARDLLGHFGGLRQILTATFDAFVATAGLGPAKYAQLQAILEMNRRHLAQRLVRQSVISSPDTTRRFFQSWLRDQPVETFACLFLDNRHRLIACEALFRGTVDSANIYPREVVRRCLDFNAAAVVFAHNHPSGVAEPSSADLRLTRELQQALGLLDVRVLDHLIVGDGVTTSFVERGLL